MSLKVETNPRVQDVLFYAAKVDVRGDTKDVVAVVKQYEDGRRYYDHSIERKTPAGTPKSVPAEASSGPDGGLVSNLAPDNADVKGGTQRFSFAGQNAKTADTITVDGIERPTTNSNGQPIHSTREGVENFWRWFSGSKTIDAQGRPRVFYHGTYGDFSKFQPARQTRGLIFFTPDTAIADEYATA